MHHRFKWFIHLWAHDVDREMSTPSALSCGVWPIYLYLTFLDDSVAEWLACCTQEQKGPGSNRSRDVVG